MKKYSFLSFILLVVAGITAAFVVNEDERDVIINGTLVFEDNPFPGDGALLTCTILDSWFPNCSYTATGSFELSATDVATFTDMSSGWGTTVAYIE